ncbi:MAG: hypothetical protein GXP26_01090 [Planctomycetes bacterium]|nr:hypothetical protein [Planctomycetota bacterium]
MLKRLTTTPLPVLCAIACALTTTFTSVTAAQNTDRTPEQQRFLDLEKSLSGTTLVGHFTDSNEEATTLTAERYELQSVRHVGKDQWRFLVRIRYDERDVTLPLTLPIHWAGDTPVVSINKFAIPGLGTYTARVMFFADHYAGFWSGADHGGHLFGIIKRNEKETTEAAPVKK